jgi:hypothetical protein
MVGRHGRAGRSADTAGDRERYLFRNRKAGTHDADTAAQPELELNKTFCRG